MQKYAQDEGQTKRLTAVGGGIGLKGQEAKELTQGYTLKLKGRTNH